ncbi:hypothetical protein PL75_01750 [Neisseria arctica]|uniref:Uncharacterized protein n=1 Tax=Neisseria arctica TaxID=1470200 RepID=A0A0J0YUB7_9NEIS|nr:hypothetical protein [Neisseria arctica]KLT73694.1 hypothetical protein PL75_01750 [Neisseria arctica]UOO85829.1 hypothetical protein LVJ86_06175 [Neisseria arctica]
MAEIQERQNQRIIDFAEANFSKATHEYGRHDLAGRYANKQGEKIDPSRFKAMPNNKEIFIYEGLEYPVLCDKIRYYEEKVFKKRLLGKVDILVLKIMQS